jgi:hypothetical protein
LFTDGISDQFGGEKGKKLMSKNFQQMLLQVQDYSIIQQHEKMDEFIHLWKKQYEQTDDMLLIGIEL